MAPYIFALACTIFCEISDNHAKKVALKELKSDNKNYSDKAEVLKMLEEHNIGK